MSDPEVVENDRETATAAATPERPRRHRRVIVIIAVAAAATIAIAVTLIVTVTRPHPFTSADARRVGVPVMVGQTLFLPNGTVETFPLAQGDAFGQLAVVPDGLLGVVLHDEPDATGSSDELRLMYPGGSYGQIATSLDSRYEVTSDGRTVVIRSGDADGKFALRSIDIATDRQLHAFGDGNQDVDAFNGDWALISDSGDGSSRPSVAWNVRTGAVIPLASSNGVAAWGVAPDGDVLRGVDTDLAPALTSAHACYDLVAPQKTAKSAVIPTTRTGYCGALNVTEGMLSPDGVWAVLLVRNGPDLGDSFLALRTADLHAGRWSPIVIDVGGMSKPLFWDSPTTFIAPYVDDSGTDGYERCSVDGHCHDLGVPGTALVAGVYGG